MGVIRAHLEAVRSARRAAEFGAARARVGTAMREGRSDEGRTGALPRLEKGRGGDAGCGGAGRAPAQGQGRGCDAPRGGAERERMCVCVCVCDRERASVRRVGGPGGGAG